MDMNSQASDSNEEDFGVNSEEEDDDDDGGDEEDPGDIETYYDGVASDVEQQGADSFDPEEYQFICLTYKESQRVLTEEVNTVAAALKVSVGCCSITIFSLLYVQKPGMNLSPGKKYNVFFRFVCFLEAHLFNVARVCTQL